MSEQKLALWKLAEELFKESNALVIAVVKVQECLPGVSQLIKQKKTHKAPGKPRVVILTGEWSPEASKVQLTVHSCRPLGTSFQVNKSFSLTNLIKMEVYQGEPGVLHNIQAVELSFIDGNGEAQLAFQTQDEDVLLQILAPLWHFVVKFPPTEQKRPGLVTYPHNTVSMVVQMEAWNANHLDPEIERKLKSNYSGGGEEDENGKDSEEEGSGKLSLVSAKEERDLQALLDRFALEVGDIEDFQKRLQEEMTALEAANVHTILESGARVGKVQESFNDALALLDDVNENLATFDTKLLVMREDIAAIEARNNRLELQTRNNSKLLGALDSLLERLQLPPSVERALKSMHFDDDSLDDMVKAGWELYDLLEGLSEARPEAEAAATGISPALGNMHAVADQRARLAVFAKSYADRASAFIGKELMKMTDSALQATAASRGPGAEKCLIPDHTSLRDETDHLTSLLHVVRSLQPDILDTLGKQYTSAFNTLLRKEVRLYTSDLRKVVTASVSHLPPEPILLKGNRKEGVRVLPSFTSNQSNLSFCLNTGASHSTSSSAETPRSSQVPRSPKGSEDVMQPSEAYSQLLRHWIPLLLDELDSCADFLMLKEEDSQPSASRPAHGGKTGGRSAPNGARQQASHASNPKLAKIVPGGQTALQALLASLNTDFMNIAGLASRQQQAQAVPMLATTLLWLKVIADVPLAAPLKELLQQCSSRILGSFEQFIDETVSGVQRFESKNTLSLAEGVKKVHVLPFVPNFASLVNRLEELQETAQADTPPDLFPSTGVEEEEESEEEEEVEHSASEDEDSEEGGQLVREVSLQVSNLQALGSARRVSNGAALDSDALRKQLRGNMSMGALQRAPGMGLMRRRSNPILETGNSLEASQSPSPRRQLTDAEIPTRIPPLAMIHSARDVVDPAYAILTKAIFGTLERIAATDPKHGMRLRLENYICYEALLGRHTDKIPVLAYFVTKAAANKEIATQAYIQQQLEYARLWRVVEFSQGLENLVKDVGAEEAPLQPGYQASDLRTLLLTCLGHCDRRLGSLHSRIAKHLQGNTELVDAIWRQLRELLENSFSSLVEQSATLYPTVQFPLSPSTLRSYLITVG